MTREELMALVKLLKWERRILPGLAKGQLRCEKGDCPLAAAYRIKFGVGIPNWAWRKAADELGLDRLEAEIIVREADYSKVPELESTNA